MVGCQIRSSAPSPTNRGAARCSGTALATIAQSGSRSALARASLEELLRRHEGRPSNPHRS